jgi:chromosome segregation ATPase
LGGAAAQPGPKSEKAALSDEEKTKAEFDVIEKQGLVRYAAALNTQAERLEARISAAEEKLQQLEVSISKTRTRADKAHERIGMLKLGIAGTSTSPEYVCGKQHTEAVDNRRFM